VVVATQKSPETTSRAETGAQAQLRRYYTGFAGGIQGAGRANAGVMSRRTGSEPALGRCSDIMWGFAPTAALASSAQIFSVGQLGRARHVSVGVSIKGLTPHSPAGERFIPHLPSAGPLHLTSHSEYTRRASDFNHRVSIRRPLLDSSSGVRFFSEAAPAPPDGQGATHTAANLKATMKRHALEDAEMPERTCPNCGKTVPDWKYCAECGQPLTQAAGAEESGSETPPSTPPAVPEVEEPAAPAPEPGEPPPPPPPETEGLTADSLEPRGEHREPAVAGATPMQQAAEEMRTPAPPIDGQLRCPDCGEAVYEGERVCWSCGRRLEGQEQAAETAEPLSAPPTSGAPAVAEAQAEAARAPTRAGAAGYSGAARPQQRPRRRPSEEATGSAWWAFGLGLLSVFTCGVLGLLGVAAIWLGVSAARRDGGPVAVAGAVFGAMGLLMLLAWIIALAIAMPELLRPGPTHIVIPSFP